MAGRQGWHFTREGRKQTGYKPQGSGETHFNYRGDNVSEEMGRERARKLYPLTPCVRCGEPGRDRHHKDGNTLNNKPENIEILCRRCHMEVDNRIEHVRRLCRVNSEQKRQRYLLVVCRTCGRRYPPYRHGECASCAIYRSRTGRTRPPAKYTRSDKGTTRRTK